MILRDYQREAVQAIYDYFGQGGRGNPLVVLPTGSGKSVLIAEFVRSVIEQWPDQRIVIATHARELIEQDHLKLMAIWPGAPAGIYSAGLKRRELHDAVTFCGIQSVYNRAHQLGRVDLVLVDEAHLIPKSGEGMYRQFLEACRGFNPALKVIGFTATPYRLKSGLLHEGEGRIFTDICYDTDILRLIDAGYLAPLVPKQMRSQIDTASVGTRNGEFIPGQLQAAADRADLTRAALDEVFRHGADRKSWLFFCSGVAHAEHVAEALRDRGVGAATVTGETPTDERDEILRAYKAGELRAITNCDVLTTGFDAPRTDLLVMLRPTQSPGLYVQIMGRGMRVAPDKPNCLVLDFAGNVLRHGPINEIRPQQRTGRGGGVTPQKVCPNCEAIVHAAVQVCPECLHAWPPRAIQHEATASTLEIISRTAEPTTKTVAVAHMAVRRHDKPGSLPMLRVDYHAEIPFLFAPAGAVVAAGAQYTDWVLLEHGGYPARKAEAWWRTATDMTAPPLSVAEALRRANEIRRPRHITVRKTGRYWEVVHREYETVGGSGKGAGAVVAADDRAGRVDPRGLAAP
jgi:DNA repair protein RadD